MAEIAETTNVYGNFTFKCRCGATVYVVDTVQQEHDCPRWALSLLLRRAARDHPSGIADAQAEALLAAGWTPPALTEETSA